MPDQELTAALDRARAGLLIVTGAGVSQASGIQTFRGPDPGAVWKVSDVEMATRRLLIADPVTHWRWYLKRFAAVDGAEPNEAHHAVRRLETWAQRRSLPFTVVTQNIDLLHERAGSENLLKVHGTAARVRCSSYTCALGEPDGSIDRDLVDLDAFRAQPSRDKVPRCPECDDLLRPHVLFFDEYYDSHRDYAIDDVLAAAERSDLVIFVGTSFSVGVTEMLVRNGWLTGATMFSIDPHASPPAGYPLRHIAEAAEELLPRVTDALTADHPAREADS